MLILLMQLAPLLHYVEAATKHSCSTVARAHVAVTPSMSFQLTATMFPQELSKSTGASFNSFLFV